MKILQSIKKPLVFTCLTIMTMVCITSCSNEDVENDFQQEETLNYNNFKNIFTIGEIKSQETKSKKKELNLIPFNCGISSPLCANPKQIQSYTYTSPDLNPNITWTINSGDISIINGQGTNTVSLYFGTNFSGGSISVLGTGPSNCFVKKNILPCDSSNSNCSTYILSILDEYIDGTQSGSDIVYLNAGGNHPSNTTYSWKIERQNGTTQYYSASTVNPRSISASINNRITQATVTAEYKDCIQTVVKTFRCSIPNSDINGNLFPECLKTGLGFGY